MYILAKGDKYMADDKNFPSNVSLTKNIKDAYVFTEYREATWIASIKEAEWMAYMSDMEVEYMWRRKRNGIQY